jgi:hypothetical protein
MRLRCEKKGDPGGNQRRRILQACISSTNLSVTDFIAHYQYGSFSNGLKQPVTDRALIGKSLLPIGLTFVTGSFNIPYNEFM